MHKDGSRMSANGQHARMPLSGEKRTTEWRIGVYHSPHAESFRSISNKIQDVASDFKITLRKRVDDVVDLVSVHIGFDYGKGPLRIEVL